MASTTMRCIGRHPGTGGGGGPPGRRGAARPGADAASAGDGGGGRAVVGATLDRPGSVRPEPRVAADRGRYLHEERCSGTADVRDDLERAAIVAESLAGDEPGVRTR